VFVLGVGGDTMDGADSSNLEACGLKPQHLKRKNFLLPAAYITPLLLSLSCHYLYVMFC
jgi:hypothetical protein